MSTKLTLYDNLASGNCYKVRLVLKQLGIPYESVQLNIQVGATRTPEFLKKNPNGRVPLLEIKGKGYLAESHAIVLYLAKGSRLIPGDPLEMARMWQWMCFEQYHIEPTISLARYWLRSLGKSESELGERLTEKIDGAHRALGVLEIALTGRQFLVGNEYSLADISLYAYTHVAEEGQISLARYPSIRMWLRRVAAQSNHHRIDVP